MRVLTVLFVLLIASVSFAQLPFVYDAAGNGFSNLYAVEDTTALKLLNAPFGNAVVMKSISATDDQGGGIFVVESSGTADAKNIFAHPNTSYKWVRAGSKNIYLQGTVCGTDAFTTTATVDTVLISGALATDHYFLTGKGGSVDQQDVLQAEAKADTLIVHRLASGASALQYNWLRIR